MLYAYMMSLVFLCPNLDVSKLAMYVLDIVLQEYRTIAAMPSKCSSLR
jgi:hypothetical protein